MFWQIKFKRPKSQQKGFQRKLNHSFWIKAEKLTILYFKQKGRMNY